MDKIEIIQPINESYYKELYSNWVLNRSKYRKWQNLSGICFIILGIVLLSMKIEKGYLAIASIGFGIHLVVDYFYTRYKWLKARLRSKQNNENVHLILEDNQVQLKGPISETTANWSIFTKAVITKDGLFLLLEGAQSIFFQKKRFRNPETITILTNKINN